MTALSDGLVSHAYIIEGARGVGKKTLARAFVRALLCQGPIRRSGHDGHLLTDSCGQCDACTLFDHQNHPDVHYLRPSEDKKGITVSQIRDELVTDMQIRPYLDSYKIYVVEQADTMNQQAQNALLKTIEEPPAYGIILLLAESSSAFLPTILSRCVRISLSPLPSSLVEKALLSFGMDQEKAAIYAAYSQGCIGQALSLSGDETFASLRRELFDFLGNVPSLPMTKVLNGGKLLDEYKSSLDTVFSLMTMWFRDVAVYKETGDRTLLFCPDYEDPIAACAAYYGFDRIADITEAVRDTYRKLMSNVNASLAADCLMIALK